MSSDAPPHPRYIPPSRRRDKPILSCSLCRRRKLKCDRQQPCKACVDRGLSLSCTFSRHPQPSSTPETKSNNNVHDRIDQLEKLVTTLMNEKRTGIPESQSPMSAYSPKVIVGDTDLDVPGTSDRVKLETNETKYTNSGHWTSILDGIAELRDTLDEIPTAPPDRDSRDEVSGPDLMFSRHKHATHQEILAALPSRSEGDQLVVKYFAYMDMAPTLMHRPTFLREYEDFWRDPPQASIMWLGLLYAVFAIATRFDGNVHEFQDQNLDSSKIELIAARIAFFREKVVQCLVLGDYTKCPPYTLELFISYFVMEYLRSRDTQFGIWLLCGTLVRIALRMGYHREPSRFPNISPFRAEMRRRLWSTVVQLDLMSSIQNGLPRMIQPYIYDAMEPRNLTDADLDEDMTELPPSRPDSESTVLLFTVVRNRGLQIMARIVDLSNTGQSIPYRETMELDTALQSNYNNVPSSLKGMTTSSFDTESDIGMRKMYLGVTYLKASLMLHRPYMLLGRTDSRYAYSRMACLDAALEILDFQAILDKESRSSKQNWSSRWRLWTSSWRQSSLVNYDFLLATTVLLSDLDKDLISPMPTTPLDVPRVRFKSGQPTRTEIVKALRGTCAIWAVACDKSREAIRVVTAINLMLRKVDASQHLPEADISNTSSSDPFATSTQQQESDIATNIGTDINFFDFNNPQFSLPFPMADMPMDFGGFDWDAVAPEYAMPAFDTDLQNSYYGQSGIR